MVTYLIIKLKQSSGDRASGKNVPTHPIPLTAHSDLLESQMTSNHDELCRTLLAVWPNDQDLDMILKAPVNISTLFHGVVFLPYRVFVSTQMATPRHILQLPAQGSHPVLIARKLLLLGTYLQGARPSIGSLAGMSSDYRTIMSRIVNTATRLVTSNDKIISGSLEGIECLIIESMYLNNSGDLHGAWLISRKAMAMAQMMGLHTGTDSPSMVLDVETRKRINPNDMWFRLVLSDRYLSLMLGLPQGTQENVFASPKALERCTAIERMERMEAVAAGLLLERNSAERLDLAVTNKIDKILQDAAALMSPQWWLTPDFAANDDIKAFEGSVRLMIQFAHRHLLVKLHLPYMMQLSSTKLNYDYNKMTAASASREIITQFVSFRNHPISATAYCRGIDIVAFIASITLCLAHIEARQQNRTHTGKSVTTIQSLNHQRMSDRALLERTLENMEEMALKHNDLVAQKIFSSILEPLLYIEKDSAKGICYRIQPYLEADKKARSDSNDNSDVLYIHIPYSGAIKIEKLTSNADNIEAIQKQPQEPVQSVVQPASYDFSNAQAVNAIWQAVPSSPSPSDPLQLSTATYWEQDLSSFTFNAEQDSGLDMPGLATDDWDLHGVDMTLLGSLTKRPTSSIETWPQTHTQ